MYILRQQGVSVNIKSLILSFPQVHSHSHLSGPGTGRLDSVVGQVHLPDHLWKCASCQGG